MIGLRGNASHMSRAFTDRARRGVGTTALVTLGLLGTAIGAGRIASAVEPTQDARSQQVFATVCGKCHPVERVTAMRRSRSQWEETITSMITARGAQVSDEDFDTVLTYLSREYGRVDINRAEPDDIVEVLGLTEQMASSIVAHRKQHGPFENFEALVKVPGVDRDALEKKRDAITF